MHREKKNTVVAAIGPGLRRLYEDHADLEALPLQMKRALEELRASHQVRDPLAA